MNTEKNLSPQESLQLIATVVASTKQSYKQHSVFFILWGTLVAIASFTEYGLRVFSELRPTYLPWMILMPIGAIASIYFGKKQSSEQTTLTFYSHFLNIMWQVMYVAFFLTVVICIKLRVSPTIFILLLSGIGTSISGLVMKNRAFLLGGITLGVAALVCTQVDYTNQLLVNGIAFLLGYVLPNYFLTSKQPSENV